MEMNHPTFTTILFPGDNLINIVESHKHLGLTLTKDLNWFKHIDLLSAKCGKIIGVRRKFKYRWGRKALETCYRSFIRPIIEYGNVIYDTCTQGDSQRMEHLQHEGARIVAGLKKGTSHDRLLMELGWQTLI